MNSHTPVRPVRVAAVTQLMMACALAAGSAKQANHLFGAKRTGYTDQELTLPLRQVWTHRPLHKPRQAWREPAWEVQRIDFDYAYPFSAGNGLVFVASSSDHAVCALDLKTGKEQWRFITEGPVRLAPHVEQGRLWFSSDDGVVYCLDSREGRLVWKYRPRIPDERLTGNEQMISRWPARSGVLVRDGRAYTTFGMWSPEGIVVSCLDADTGAVIWENDSSGTYYMTQPHFETMGGVSPQGYLALTGDVLVVPCGRATPAFFNAKTGGFLYHESEGLFPGGAWTMLHGNLTFTPCEYLKKPNPVQPEAAESDISPEASLVAIDTRTREEVFHLHGALQGVVTPDGILNLIGRQKLVSVALKDVLAKAPDSYSAKRGSSEGHFVEINPLRRWETRTGRVYELIQAGATLVAGERGKLSAYAAADGKKLWETTLTGDVRELLVVDGALLVGTTEGETHCFRPEAGASPAVVATQPISVPVSDQTREHTTTLLAAAGAPDGYAVLLGDADASLLTALCRQSEHLWHWAAGDRDVAGIRRQLTSAGLYGTRAAVHNHAAGALPYTDFLANLIMARVDTVDDLAGLPAAELYRVLRPSGGVAVVACPNALRPDVKRWLTAGGLPTAELSSVPVGWRVERGVLPGAGVWTHPYADAGRTGASADRRVRLPLEVLWFGSVGPADIVSRHYRAPPPLAINGRMFVAGLQRLHAIDAYNGRTLWEKALPGVGRWPAAYRGGSIAADAGAVYALQGDTCLRLDQRTGRALLKYQVPEAAKQRTPPTPKAKNVGVQNNAPLWEYLAVTERLILGTYGRPNIRRTWWSQAYPENSVLFALDKQTGTLAWQYEPVNTIDSAAIAVDGDRLFLIDGTADFELHTRPRRRPSQPKDVKLPQSRLLLRIDGAKQGRLLKALDLATGRELWQTAAIGAGQRSLWAARGVVLATPSVSHGDRLKYSGPGLTAFSANGGKVLWTRKTAVLDPLIIGDVVYLPNACELRTGKPIMSRDPLTRAPMPSIPHVTGGCGRHAGCPNLLMKRSGSMGFADLRQGSGTYHYPNMRASCWMNMVPACGLVLAPEGSSSCPCAYNYKTSIALKPADRHNHWGLARRVRRAKTARIRSLHVNLGAPGDKPTVDGEIWYAFPRPSTSGPRGAGGMAPVPRDAPPVEMLSPGPSVQRVACNPDWNAVAGTEHPWLFTYGLRGALVLRITLGAKDARPMPYRVALHFCELEGEHPRSSPFSVKLQGRSVFADIDVVRDAGAMNRALTREATLEVGSALTLEIVPTGTAPLLCAVSVLAAER